jgi:methylase of polypeptide subunit release factors
VSPPVALTDVVDLAPLDPRAVLAEPRARAAFAALAGQLRDLAYDGTAGQDELLIRAARGEPVARDALQECLAPQTWDALRACGAVVVDADLAVLTTKIFPMRSVLTLLPPADATSDVVYLGLDSILLFDIVWKRAGIGHLAADLGTGNGFLAAAMATRFDYVVAADVSFRCATTAQMVPVLNGHLAGRVSAAQLDVAAGLRPKVFDLVTANSPWVPETEGPDGGPGRLFAAGGPTGFELPRRFLDEGAELLAPGGRAFIACMDIEFDDGARPLLDHVPVLVSRGFEVEVIETGLRSKDGFDAWAAEKAPGATRARHVVVIVSNPA